MNGMSLGKKGKLRPEHQVGIDRGAKRSPLFLRILLNHLKRTILPRRIRSIHSCLLCSPLRLIVQPRRLNQRHVHLLLS